MFNSQDLRLVLNDRSPLGCLRLLFRWFRLILMGIAGNQKEEAC